MPSYRKLQVVKTSTNFAEALKLVSVPLVSPKPEQIRVKIIFVGVNATDVNMINGLHKKEVPFDCGFDAIGIVDEIGSSVPARTFTLKQPVLVTDLANDAFSEYLYKEPASLLALPALDPKYLVTISNGLTAAISLEKAGEIKEGQKVLITAASGGTGQIAVQWAKSKGAYVIGTTSSEDKAKYLKELGVDLVINYKSQNLDKVLSEKFPKGVDLIWETIGGENFKTLFNHLVFYGRMVVLGSISGYIDEDKPKVLMEDIDSKILWKGLTITSFMLFGHLSEFPKYLPEMINKIEDGSIQVRVDQGDKSPVGRFVGLGHVYRAEQWLHSKNSLGKVVVKIQEE